MVRQTHILTVLAVVLCVGAVASALERFPPPEFETDYERPTTTTPHPRQGVWEYVDAGVLIVTLALAACVILRWRNRKAVFTLMVFSLVYFGFFRQGCVCPIGAIQNVTLTGFDAEYVVPIAVLVFFAAPLVFTLFFGRAFCGAVCPLGAIQDVVLIRPVKVPGWLESALRLLAYTYLGAAVLFAATGSAFIICRYDPFVGFFRLSGNWNILVLGAALLLVGLFVGRPYCRFLCPYGIILRHFSRLSRWRVSITPTECVKCRLCEDACPLLTKHLAAAKNELGDLFGKEVFFVSISNDPNRDTPDKLTTFAKKQNAHHPGWTFVTGNKKAVDAIITKLGLYSEKIEEHNTLLLAGNTRTRHWIKIVPNIPPAAIAQKLRDLAAEG